MDGSPSFFKIVKEEKRHCYKRQLLRMLNKVDPDRRMGICAVLRTIGYHSQV